MNKDLNYYMALPYTVILRRDEEGDYIARIDELEGCIAHGPTPQEALTNLEEVKSLWLTDCIESGDPIPEPVAEDVLPSGRWVQRVPRSLHRKLIAFAKQDNVSLNQFVTAVLSEAVGVKKVKAAPTTLMVSAESPTWRNVSELTEGRFWTIEQKPWHGRLMVTEALRLLSDWMEPIDVKAYEEKRHVARK